MRFTKDFLIGAATAAHQVEGNNIHSDYWAMEHMKTSSFAEPSLDAVDHYNRYEEDIRLLADAGLNAYRFSIEWARIEPEEGKFDEQQIEHYRSVIRCCRENGVEPMVTLHHFTSPKWLITKGGWEAETTPADFARYTRYVMEQLGSELSFVCTINEANMGLQVTKVAQRFIQQMKAKAAKSGGPEAAIQMGINLEKMLAGQKAAAQENMAVFGTEKLNYFCAPRSKESDELTMKAHRAAVAVIRETAPHVKVGMSLSIHDIQAAPGCEAQAEQEWSEEFSHYVPYMEGDDFLGIQNYTRSVIGENGQLPAPEGAELTQMGYEFYPQGLANVISRAAQAWKGDIYITENGIGTADDSRRVAFIDIATQGVAACMEKGIPVKGYFYWTLMDNFEWQKGYAMTFGLIAVDRATQQRRPKESLRFLGGLKG